LAVKIRIEDIKFSKDLYPRFGLDNETVNLYLLNLDALPPIVLTKNFTLIDGYHRLTAYKLAGRSEIEAEILDIPEDQVLVEAAKRNAIHGKQLTKEEKRSLAIRLYEKGLTQERIAEILAVARTTITEWLKKIREAKEEELKRLVVEYYLQCYTHGQIANLLGLTRSRITQIVKNVKSDIEANPPFPSDLWLYTYKLMPKLESSTMNFPGNLPSQLVENVLYYWTKPFDTVVDPMAGGGVVIDVCRKMYRRYRAYDINPVRDEIKKWDIKSGFPKEAKNCNMIFLDPPYYKKKAEEYGENSVSGFDRENFIKFLEKLARDTYKTLRKGSYVALVFGDYLDYEDETKHILAPDIYGLFIKAGFNPTMRVQIPLSTEQWHRTKVEEAKKEKRLLSIARDLYIFKRIVGWKKLDEQS
jgi:predicted HTH domain antitoxin